MTLRFVDLDPDDAALAADQRLVNSLRFAERQSQRLTSEATINSSMAQQLASAGHRPILPDLQYQPPAPHPQAPSFDPGDLHEMGDDQLPAFLPGTRYPMDRMRDDYIRHDPRSGVA